MTLFNTFSKHLVYLSVSINILAATAIVAGAFYILFSNWGPVDTAFLIGPCVTILMYGLILFGGSVLGHLGLQYQYKRQGVFTHKFILSLFLAFQLACIAVEIYAYVNASRVTTQYASKSKELADNPTTWYADALVNSVKYLDTEKYYANLFNNLFFGAASAYTAVESKFFWEWIASKCPSSLYKVNCIRFFPYSHSSCGADQNTCYGDKTSSGPACPYSICRKPLLDYFVEQILVLESAMAALIAFQCFVVALVAFLIFHNEYKVDYRRRSLIKRTAKPKTLGRKRKTIAANQNELLAAMNTVKNQRKFAGVEKDADREAEAVDV